MKKAILTTKKAVFVALNIALLAAPFSATFTAKAAAAATAATELQLISCLTELEKNVTALYAQMYGLMAKAGTTKKGNMALKEVKKLHAQAHVLAAKIPQGHPLSDGLKKVVTQVAHAESAFAKALQKNTVVELANAMEQTHKSQHAELVRVFHGDNGLFAQCKACGSTKLHEALNKVTQALDAVIQLDAASLGHADAPALASFLTGSRGFSSAGMLALLNRKTGVTPSRLAR